MVNLSGYWTAERLGKTARNSEEWLQFVAWQKERIMERLQRYNNTETVKTQLAERGDLTPYQRYKITTVSKFLLQAMDRMNAGNYGLCSTCGCEIPVQRLLLVPGALRCMDCETKKP
jgi:RNA polymerase-binding transcription factor DksA